MGSSGDTLKSLSKRCPFDSPPIAIRSSIAKASMMHLVRAKDRDFTLFPPVQISKSGLLCVPFQPRHRRQKWGSWDGI